MLTRAAPCGFTMKASTGERLRSSTLRPFDQDAPSRHSCHDRRVMQPATMRLPSIRMEARADATFVRRRCRRSPVQPRMRAVSVVVALELKELHLQIRGGPKQRAVQALASNTTNQAFDEGMRQRRVRHRLDFFDVENAQVGQPSMELNSRSRSVLRYFGGVWPRVARLNMRHSPAPSTAPACTSKPTIRRVRWSITTSTK
jgi:hypothetical protein